MDELVLDGGIEILFGREDALFYQSLINIQLQIRHSRG